MPICTEAARRLLEVLWGKSSLPALDEWAVRTIQRCVEQDELEVETERLRKLEEIA